ncbi:MAG TPA: Dabb family protein [Chitinispirillaceae bacterium]|nr:Dabb family protein [Chitinispirillaceae bacterium]
MVVHIVMWKCIGNSRQEQQKNAVKIKKLLDSLLGKVPQIVDFEVGLDLSCTSVSYDVSLYSSFRSPDDLQGYANHPEHKEVAAVIGKLVAGRHVVDYEK